ncbi:MAG TPA: VWA domain-containing protein [Bryobacteraceae bacterium]|jgi:Ca-activated chloride channel family protein|nr:VWA domain-containing protein [Bryobacteraceae bacterium]
MLRHRTVAWKLLIGLLALRIAGNAQWKPLTPAPSATTQQPAAQPPQPQRAPGEPPVFSVKVNLVRLLVSVHDQYGGLETNLSKQDFQVFDTGALQDIAVFERNTSLPLSVAILIDTSGSTQIDLHYEVDSVLKFIPALVGAGNPEDSFALFSFNYRTNLEADFSRNPRRAERALHSLHGEGGTSLYDAIYLASDVLLGREGRHVMVIVTDGGDTTSYKRYDDALAAAQRADVVLYPVVVVPIEGDAGRNTGGEHALATLAASTGGRIFNPDGFDQLDQAFAEILQELRTQYMLGFYPRGVPEHPRQFHPVRVKIQDPSLRVTARSGYYEP